MMHFHFLIEQISSIVYKYCILNDVIIAGRRICHVTAPLFTAIAYGSMNVMKKLMEKKLLVLSILFENLRNRQPQVVGIEKFATEMQLELGEIRQLLLCMNEAGEIESDLDGQYSLITQTGLCLLNSMKPERVTEYCILQ